MMFFQNGFEKTFLTPFKTASIASVEGYDACPNMC